MPNQSELLENIQLMLISNKNDEIDLYERCILNLRENLNENQVTNKMMFECLRKLKKFDTSNSIEEHLRKIPGIFELKDSRSFDYQLILELLCKSILDAGDLSQAVLKKLFHNIETYFGSIENKIISFTSLYLMLFFIYKNKRNNVDSLKKFNEKYKVEAYLDQEPESNPNMITTNDNNLRALAYLRLYLNESDNDYIIKAFKLCHSLDVPLSLSKMLEFSLMNFDEHQINNLIMFIGPTGVGKSTIINYLSGTEYDQVDDEYLNILVPKERHFNKLKCTEKGSLFSETLYPEILKFNDGVTEMNFVDMPGFFDQNSSDNKSMIAALGVPILVRKVDRIKAIVIVIDFHSFDTIAAERGSNFERISRNLFQLFEKFEENRQNINILFAITKPPITRHDFKLAKIRNKIGDDLNIFDERLKNEEQKIKETVLKKIETQNKIEFYNKFIEALETNDSVIEMSIKSDIELSSKLNNDRSLVAFGNELFVKYMAARGKIQFYDNYENKKLRVDLTVENWKLAREELSKSKDEYERSIKEYEAEKLMISLTKEAIKSNNLFIFRCIREEDHPRDDNDDKESILQKLNGLNENFIIKEYFNFESSQKNFKKIRDWCFEKVKEAIIDYNKLLDSHSYIQEKDITIENKQREILSIERDLDAYMKPINFEKLTENDYTTIKILQDQMTHSNNIYLSYGDVIKELNEVNEDINNRIHEKDKIFQQFISESDHKPDLFWPFMYTYPFPKEKSDSEKDGVRDLTEIVKVYFTCWDLARKTKLWEVTEDKDTSEKESTNINVGRLTINKLELSKGVFDAKFVANTNFNGYAEFKVFAKAKDIKEFIDMIKSNELSIADFTKKLENEKKNLENIEEKIKKEENLIELKRELIKQNTSEAKLPILKERLLILNYNLKKFNEYLLKKNLDTDYETIEKIFDSLKTNLSFLVDNQVTINTITNDLNRARDSAQDLNNKKLNLNDQENKVLIAISKEIGLTIPCLAKLIDFLNSNENGDNKSMLEKERDKLIEERNTKFENFKKIQKICLKKQKDLNIYDRIVDIVDFSKESRTEFIEFEKLRVEIKNMILLKIDLQMKPISDIKLDEDENNELYEQNENLAKQTASKLEMENAFLQLNRNTYKEPNSFIVDFEFEYLYQLSSQRKRAISINKLIPTSDEVFAFFLPQLIHSAAQEIIETQKKVIELIIKRASSSSLIASKLFMLLKCEIESLEKMPSNKYDTLTRSIIVNHLKDIENQISKEIKPINPIKQEVNQLKIFIECLEDFSKYDKDAKKQLNNSNVLQIFDSRYKFFSIKSRETEKHLNSKTKPVEYRFSVAEYPVSSSIEYREYPVLFKRGDDLRKDFLVIQAIELIKKIFAEEKFYGVYIHSYNILPTGSNEGLIQLVESKSVSSILKKPSKKPSSITLYLKSQKSDKIDKIKENYFKSCAGFLLVNYLFGIGDRHYDNIMITPDGKMFHIDFGFVMTDEPKQVVNLRLAPEIKWSSDLVEPILSDSKNINNPQVDKNYKRLMENCCQGFLILRKHAKILVNIFRPMLQSKIHFINQESVEKFNQRFLLNLSEEEAKQVLINKINYDYNSFFGYLIDIYHESKLLHKIFERR